MDVVLSGTWYSLGVDIVSQVILDTTWSTTTFEMGNVSCHAILTDGIFPVRIHGGGL